MNKRKLKQVLKKATDCTIQHDGWPCGSCFFAMSESLTNADWQALLLKRGDTDITHLDNLPNNIEASLNKIYQIAESC